MNRLGPAVARALRDAWPAGYYDGQNLEVDACLRKIYAWLAMSKFAELKARVLATHNNHFPRSPAVQRYDIDKDTMLMIPRYDTTRYIATIDMFTRYMLPVTCIGVTQSGMARTLSR